MYVPMTFLCSSYAASYTTSYVQSLPKIDIGHVAIQSTLIIPSVQSA